MSNNKPFIDIHTHCAQEGALSIVSLYELDHLPQSKKHVSYSMGLHPWHLNFDSWELALSQLETLLKQKDVIAFGEIGLDRVKGAEFSQQIEYFKKQLELFKKSSFKVCFIHCVRAWSDLLPLIGIGPTDNSFKDKIFILHDFNSSTNEFQKMKQSPNLYFSLGQNFIRPQSKIHQFLEQIPQDRLFFETDNTEIPIRELYLNYIGAINGPLTLSQLREIIDSNYQLLFS